jgi:HAD superfamily phosphoserine phosphatase-like hydrolase
LDLRAVTVSGDATRVWRFAGFDLDGTLVHGCTVLLHVGRHLGHSDAVGKLVKGYELYRLTNREVSTEAAALFAGLTKDDMLGMMEDIPRLREIDTAIAYLHQRNIHCSIATVTFDFASEWFARRFGFDSYSGIELVYDAASRLTGEVARHVDERDKAEFVDRQRHLVGARSDECFYVGDSRSDLHTFAAVGFSVALNATPEAVAAADVALQSDTLTEVLDLVPGLTSPLRAPK